MMPNSVMYFAAGMGTRMQPLTANCPKPLISVAGKPLIDHALQLGQDAGLTKAVVNVHYLADMVENHVPQGVRISNERGELLDTGGGLKAALPLLTGDTVFTMNTDAVWKGDNPFQALRAHWNPNEMDALLLVVPHERALGHSGKGDFDLAKTGSISRGISHIYTGCQIINTAHLTEIHQTVFSLNLYWDKIAEKGRFFGLEYSGTWCDVGTPASISLAEDLLNDV